MHLCIYMYVLAVITFKFSAGSYSASESDGTVDVTLLIEGQSSFDILYTITTVISDEDTAEGILQRETTNHSFY